MSQDFTDDVFAGTHNGQTDLQNMEDNFAALKSQFSGASAPSNPVAGMVWVDTTNSILKIRNLANTAWVSLYDFANDILLKGFAAGFITADMLGSGVVTEVKMATSAVNRTALKTASGNVSGTGTGSSFNVVMQDYCFFPSLQSGTGGSLYQWSGTDPMDTTARFQTAVGNGVSYNFRYRYVTSTDRPFIYAIRNANGDIEHIWACEDPPPPYWYMKSKPANFVPPLQFLEPDGAPTALTGKTEITIFDYDLIEYRDLICRAGKDKKLLHAMLTDDYELMPGSKLFRRKNLSQI